MARLSLNWSHLKSEGEGGGGGVVLSTQGVDSVSKWNVRERIRPCWQNNKGANEDGKRKFILVENNGFQDFRRGEERRGEERQVSQPI